MTLKYSGLVSVPVHSYVQLNKYSSILAKKSKIIEEILKEIECFYSLADWFI